MADPYAVAAGSIELMSQGAWRWLDPVLAECLDEVDASAGPVLDCGAGTGPGREILFIIRQAPG